LVSAECVIKRFLYIVATGQTDKEEYLRLKKAVPTSINVSKRRCLDLEAYL